jgi:hypothetical protein
MRMKITIWCSFLVLGLLARNSASSQQPTVGSPEVPTITFCELLKAQSKYAGKIVTTTAQITSGRHVTGIWDPACRGLGADLHTADSARSKPSIVELDETLLKHGMGDYPVIATLTGVLLPNQREEHSFLPQPRLVFLVSSASSIHRSSKIERR